MNLSKPYPHYCATHAVYYGSPTDTIPATMCPLCGIAKELRAQRAPRTYEVARALSWVDAVEQTAPNALCSPDKPETQAVAGSSVCPICGKDSPHYHGSEEQEARNSIVRAITDQHLLCIRLADALRGMPFPPHMPDEAGNAMRGALDEFDKKSAAYLQAALASPRSPVESAPALAPFEKLVAAIEALIERDAYVPHDIDGLLESFMVVRADRLSAVVEEVRGK